MEAIWDRLKEVYDPELGVNIVDLGLVYDLMLKERKVSVVMTLTTPGCPMHDTIVGGVKRAVEALSEVDSCEVDVVWEPAWSPDLMSEEAKESLGYM